MPANMLDHRCAAVVLIVALLWYFIPVSGSTTDTAVTSNTSVAVVLDNSTMTTMPPMLPTSTEKLIRYRRQRPYKIIKHVTRSTKRSKPRRRPKRPKISYGPPNHQQGQPITYYKPSHSAPPGIEPPTGGIEHPDFDLNDFTHLNLASTDFDLPPSSYESQIMDVDFYSHGNKGGGVSYEIHSEAGGSGGYSSHGNRGHGGHGGGGHTSSGSYSGPSHSSGSYDSPPHNVGGYEGPSHTSGSYDSPAHSSGSYDSPAHSSGSYDSPPHSGGSYDSPPHSGGGYDGPAHSSGSYDSPPHSSGSYDSPPHSGGGYDGPPHSGGGTSYEIPSDGGSGGYSSHGSGGHSSSGSHSSSGGYKSSSHDGGGYGGPSHSGGSYKESGSGGRHVPHEHYGIPSDFTYSTGFHPHDSTGPGGGHSPHSGPAGSGGGISYEPPSSGSGSDSYHPPSFESAGHQHQPVDDGHHPPSYSGGGSDSYGPPTQPLFHPNDHGGHGSGNNNHKPPISPPATRYGVPSQEIYNKRIPNTAYAPPSHHGGGATIHSYAEPPPHSGSNDGIEVMYAPAYEIHSPAQHVPQSDNSYEPTTSQGHFPQPPATGSGGGHFAEPPAYHPPQHQPQPPSYQTPGHPSQGQHPTTYESGGHFAEPPAPDKHRPQHHPPAPPPPPAPRPSYQPPQQHHNPPQSGSHPPTSIEESYRPPSQELPLNPHHKQPAYDFPKSSYEVPIYDPVPFDASNVNEQELFPPHPYDILTTLADADSSREVSSEGTTPTTSSEEQRHVTAAAALPGPIQAGTEKVHRRHPSIKQRHRYRQATATTRTTTTTTKNKHILDTPELEEAFHANRDLASYGSADSEVNESTFIETKHNKFHLQPSLAESEHHISNSWNPMRIRTSSSGHQLTTTPKIELPNSSTQTASRRKRPTPRLHHNNEMYSTKGIRDDVVSTASPQQTPSVGPPFQPRPSLDISILSIEKSHSQSYYDGIQPTAITTPTLASVPTSTARNVSRSRYPFFAPTTVAQPIHEGRSSTPKRTTKAVFETTYFKGPRLSGDVIQRRLSMRQNLPKNHKLF